MIKKKRCGCEFIIERTRGLSTISAGKYVKKCDKHKNMTENEIRRESFSDIIKAIKESKK